MISSILLLSFSALAMSIEPRSDVQSGAVCQGDFSWMNNQAGLSPCLVAAYAGGACTTNVFSVTALQPGKGYEAPNSTTGNQCTCSWANYNLLEACTACQGASTKILTWAAWQGQCGSLTPTTYWPQGIVFPNNVSVPFWAGVDPTTWNNAQFNVSQAEALSGSDHPDLTPGGNGSSSSSTTSKKSSVVGPVVGGVVGGLAFLAAVIGATLFCLRRRKTKHVTPIFEPVLDESPSVHARSMSDLSNKYFPKVVGSFGTGGLVRSAPSTTMSQSYAHSRPAMTTTSSVGHARSLTSDSMQSLSLPYNAQQQPLSPTTRTLSPISAIGQDFEQRITPFVIPTQPQPLASPQVPVREVISPISDELHIEDTPRRARLNPPAYTPHPDPAPGLPRGHIRGMGSVDSGPTSTVSSIGGMSGLIGQLGLAPGPGSEVTTMDMRSEGGDTYPSSVLGGRSSGFNGMVKRRPSDQMMHLATTAEASHQQPDV